MNENRTAEKQLTTEAIPPRPPIQDVLDAPPPVPHHPTRRLALNTDEWQQPVTPEDPVEQSSVATQFAGIELYEFAIARQRARRVLVAWMLTVLVITSMIAAAAWTLGTHLTDLTG